MSCAMFINFNVKNCSVRIHLYKMSFVIRKFKIVTTKTNVRAVLNRKWHVLDGL